MLPEEDRSMSYIVSGQLSRYRSLFLSTCKTAAYPRGTVLTRYGRKNPCMYYLLDGMVKIYTTNQNGYTRIVGYHKKDSLFAMDGICEDRPAVVSSESLTAVTVLEVTWRDLLGMAEKDSTFLPEMLRYYGSVLRLMCFDAEHQSICSATVRLASFLCLYQKFTGERSIFLTQEELASAINASRVQVARICAGFREKGLIRCTRGRTELLDLNGLENESRSK